MTVQRDPTPEETYRETLRYGVERTAKELGQEPGKLRSLLNKIISPHTDHLTDSGNASRFVLLHRDILRYVKAEKSWYVWDPLGHWRKDDIDEVRRLAARMILDCHKIALEEPDKLIREAHVKHFLKSEAETNLRKLVTLAEPFPDIVARPEDFDADPYLLNCGNGLLNLRTGDLHPHDRHALCMRRTPVHFDPDAAAPRWERFLSEVFDGNQETICFVRRALGYSLTGDTREHCAFFPFGLGANGKSVLVETVRHVLGDYAITTPPQTFLVSRDDDTSKPRNDLAALPGARFVLASESEEGSRLAEGTLKSMTGGDTVTARFLFREFFQFRPQFKLWFTTNHKPYIRGSDEGIWRRVRLIPFNKTFLGQDQDQSLAGTLRSEAPGILAWLARACAEWQESGLGSAPAVSAATLDYRAEQDLLGRFLDDRCDTFPTGSVSAKDLYNAFRSWCEAEGERTWSKKAFGMRLAERGYVKQRTEKFRSWMGLILAPENS